MHRLISFFLMMIAGAGPVLALDLIETYQLALEQDLDRSAAVFAREAALESRPQARSFLLPQLSASASVGCQRTSQRTLTPSNNVQDPARDCGELFGADTRKTENVSVLLSQTVYSREAWLNYKRSDREMALADINLAEAEQDLLLRVATAYFNVLAADDTLRFSIAERDAVAEIGREAGRGDIAMVVCGIGGVAPAHQMRSGDDGVGRIDRAQADKVQHVVALELGLDHAPDIAPFQGS